MELTLKDYQEKKYFITPDFRPYKWGKEGQIIDIEASVTTETWHQINEHIKESFFKNVDEEFMQIKNKLIEAFEDHYDKERFQQAEIETVNQILHGNKNHIIDTYGVCHEIISYINAMPVVFEEGALKLSPAINFINKSTLVAIRRYLKDIRENQKSDYHFITHLEYNNLARHFLLAEVFIKYFSFLKSFREESQYSVVTIIMACSYLIRRDVYLVPGLSKNPLNLSEIQRELSEKYGRSKNSLRNNWAKYFDNKEERKKKSMIENIRGAIKLIETLDGENIDAAVELAKEELRSAELI